MEDKVRQLIREELELYLLEEGIFDKLKSIYDGSMLKKIFTGSIIAAVSNPNIAAQQIINNEQNQISDEQMMSDFDTKVEEKQNLLQSFGLSEDTSMKIVAGVLTGARKQKEFEFEKGDVPQMDKESQIYNFQMENLEKLNDVNVVTQIVAQEFLKDVENEGRLAMVKANQQSGSSGTPVPLRSTTVGLGIEIQKTLMDKDEDITIKANKALGIDPLKLAYWDDIVQDGSNIQKSLKDLFGTIYIPKSDYSWAAENSMQNYIASQLKESKIRKLKKRLNELRGKYV